MAQVNFVVIGPPVGAVRMTRMGRFSARAKASHEYMRIVQLEARAAGLRCPLTATEERPVLIHTRCFFKDRRHPDPENVIKLVSDALFYGNSAGDKYVGGSYAPPAYDKRRPRVHITVEIPDAAVR